MFKAIRSLWSDARVDVVSKEIDDILQRYGRMSRPERHFVSSGFESALAGLEDDLGDLSNGTPEQKKSAAKAMMQAARESFHTPGDGLMAQTGRLGGYGGALLSLYLELKALAGEKPNALALKIEQWRLSGSD